MDDICQITSTNIVILGIARINIEELFDNNSDIMISCGCRVGSYIIIGVDQQVHVFSYDPDRKDESNNKKNNSKADKNKNKSFL